ncbi:MAG: exonuclease domain-containing protein [Succinivibrio dextrinosolvens]|nr:exonuclease domain-containing protein [Succinivibrio dextrinosolvens]MDY6420977.1 exonuclease domain-containing protein [Succinivibrio dextrinosolvens]MDY6465007.1 exonuclease domain-containing protein [Succinivibrio dextrinosolvens]MDY6469901.1 exonuclease domain-containing protein [Succinivibrio dextrinosolvens]
MANYKNSKNPQTAAPKYLPLPFCFSEDHTVGWFFREKRPNEKTAEFVIVDLETTGLNIARDEVIEVALLRATYSMESFDILAITKVYDGLREPSAPLSEKIVELTGLTDEKLVGHTIDFQKIFEILKGVNLIISHNASFDRPFFEKLMEGHIDSRFYWGCSIEGISWKLGHRKESTALVNLLHSCGYDYDAHRALNDVYALATLLIHEKVIKELIMNTRRGYQIVSIRNAESLSYDELRKLRFMYCSEQNKYYKTIHGTQLNFYLNGISKLGIPREFVEVKSVSGLNAFRMM